MPSAFIGFLPPKAEARANALAALRDRRETLVFYESPRRLGDTLRAMAEGFGADRQAAVALELTKRFERVVSRHARRASRRVQAMDETKGEAVIVVGGAPERGGRRGRLAARRWPRRSSGQPLRAAVDEITERFGLKRKEVYDAALALKAEE